MDLEKLIRKGKSFSNKRESIEDELIQDLTDALSTLQAENEKLRVEAEGMRSNWYKSVEEVKKLRAELEQVKQERDAAVTDLERLMLVVNSGECCMMCKHDHEHLTGPCAGQSTRCEPKWRGPQKKES